MTVPTLLGFPLLLLLYNGDGNDSSIFPLTAVSNTDYRIPKSRSDAHRISHMSTLSAPNRHKGGITPPPFHSHITTSFRSNHGQRHRARLKTAPDRTNIDFTDSTAEMGSSAENIRIIGDPTRSFQQKPVNSIPSAATSATSKSLLGIASSTNGSIMAATNTIHSNRMDKTRIVHNQSTNTPLLSISQLSGEVTSKIPVPADLGDGSAVKYVHVADDFKPKVQHIAKNPTKADVERAMQFREHFHIKNSHFIY